MRFGLLTIFGGQDCYHFTEEQIKASGPKGSMRPRPNLNPARLIHITPSPHLHESFKLILFLSPHLTSGNLTLSYGFET